MSERYRGVGMFAPGPYFCRCHVCEATFQGDKRALHCELCALRGEVKRLEAELKVATEGVADIHRRLKRGDATRDHGLAGNLGCIIDHLAGE